MQHTTPVPAIKLHCAPASGRVQGTRRLPCRVACGRLHAEHGQPCVQVPQRRGHGDRGHRRRGAAGAALPEARPPAEVRIQWECAHTLSGSAAWHHMRLTACAPLSVVGRRAPTAAEQLALPAWRCMTACPQATNRHIRASHPVAARCPTDVRWPHSRSWCRFALTGWTSWFAWRSAYLTKIASWRKRTAVASNWLATLAFGRDMSSF